MGDNDEIQSRLSDEHEVLYRLVSLTARDLRRAFQGVFKSVGITGVQFGVLLGALEDASIASIADQLLTDATSIGRVIERMERAGLVERYQRTDDRRVTWVRLLAPGRDLLAAAVPLHVQRARQVLGAVPERDRDALAGILETIRAQVGALFSER